MANSDFRASATAGPRTGEVCPHHEDVLMGADQIAEFVYGDSNLRRRIYHLAATSNLPVYRLGSILCLRKSKYLAWIEEQEQRATGGP